MIDEKKMAKVQEAIERLNYYRNCYYTEGHHTEKGQLAWDINTILPVLVKLLEEQSPADQWIPCDIAKPTESGIYWTTVEVYWCDEPVSIQLEYNHKKDEWIGGCDVIAWMPATLPEPYKGGINYD